MEAQSGAAATSAQQDLARLSAAQAEADERREAEAALQQEVREARQALQAQQEQADQRATQQLHEVRLELCLRGRGEQRLPQRL